MTKDIIRTFAKLESQVQLKRKDLAKYNIEKLESLLKVESELLEARSERYLSSEKGQKSLEDIEASQAKLLNYKIMLDID